MRKGYSLQASFARGQMEAFGAVLKWLAEK